MNINNNSPNLRAGNTENANSVQNTENNENGTRINERIQTIHNAAVGLATLHYGFLAIGLMLFFVGAPLAAFMPLFILAGVTGLLLIGLAPFANHNLATRLLGGETQATAPPRQEEANSQDMREETPAPSTSTEQMSSSTTSQGEEGKRRLRFGLNTREPQGDDDSTIVEREFFETRL